MTDKLKETIKEELGKLQKEAQDAIGAIDWVLKIEEIGKRHSLGESEINDLQVETLLILTGIQESSFYALNIENEVGTSKEEAEKIAVEVNGKIFTPIANIIEENIKKNMMGKDTTWEQNLNFVLSGGDYSSFISKRHDTIDNEPQKNG